MFLKSPILSQCFCLYNSIVFNCSALATLLNKNIGKEGWREEGRERRERKKKRKNERKMKDGRKERDKEGEKTKKEEKEEKKKKTELPTFRTF